MKALTLTIAFISVLLSCKKEKPSVVLGDRVCRYNVSCSAPFKVNFLDSTGNYIDSTIDDRDGWYYNFCANSGDSAYVSVTSLQNSNIKSRVVYRDQIIKDVDKKGILVTATAACILP